MTDFFDSQKSEEYAYVKSDCMTTHNMYKWL